MNDREALIAAVRAQVEKEKAAKAAKLAKEQEMQNKAAGKPTPDTHPQTIRPRNPDEDKSKKEEPVAKQAVEEKEAPKPSVSEPEESKPVKETTMSESAKSENQDMKAESGIGFGGITGDEGEAQETLENFGLGGESLESSGDSESGLG